MKKLVFAIVAFGLIIGGVLILNNNFSSPRQSSSYNSTSVNSALHPKYVIKKGQPFNTQNQTTSSGMSNDKGGLQNLPNVSLDKTVTITEMPYIQNK